MELNSLYKIWFEKKLLVKVHPDGDINRIGVIIWVLQDAPINICPKLVQEKLDNPEVIFDDCGSQE